MQKQKQKFFAAYVFRILGFLSVVIYKFCNTLIEIFVVQVSTKSRRNSPMIDPKSPFFYTFWVDSPNSPLAFDGCLSFLHCMHFNKQLFEIANVFFKVQYGSNVQKNGPFFSCKEVKIVKEFDKAGMLESIKENFVESVSKECFLIKHVPRDILDQQMCLEATMANLEAIRFIPDEFKNKEICFEVMKQDIKFLSCIPDHMKTEEFYLHMVQLHEKTLNFVPKRFKTQLVCLEAVEHDPCSLVHVPSESRTWKVCWAAVTQNGLLIKHVPRNVIDGKMCRWAVINNGMALQFVPEELKTVEMCIIAFKQFKWATRFFPKNKPLLDQDFVGVKLDYDKKYEM